MRQVLGYSCWGFLGKGIIDTPDGGRSHRLTLIKSILARGFDIVMLQKNRDFDEADEMIFVPGLHYSSDFPEISTLFLEYRWPIEGRNRYEDRESMGYTPDLERQNELLNYYQSKDIPIIIWDKDLKINKDLYINNSYFFEPSLFPRKGRESLLFPFDSGLMKKGIASLNQYKKEDRFLNLIYVGNQYERDSSFESWIDKVAGLLKTKVEVYGNWTKYPEIYERNLKRFPNSFFRGRIGFDQIFSAYKTAFSTVLIAPEEYYIRGQFTQRLFESISNLCIPIAPALYRGVERVIIPELIVKTPLNLAKLITKLRKLSNDDLRLILLKQLKKLALFSPEKISKKIIDIIKMHGRLD